MWGSGREKGGRRPEGAWSEYINPSYPRPEGRDSTYPLCSAIVTLDPAPPACYAKRADSDAGSSVPRAAVGSDSLARWRGCIKGASRRSRGHCRTMSASGYVPLARQVAGATSHYTGIFSLFHTRKLPYFYTHVCKILCRRLCCNAIF